MAASMKRRSIAKTLRVCRIETGKGFLLTDHAPDALAGGGLSHDEAVAQLAAGVASLAAQQQLLAAQADYALLAIFQGIDAAGKDSTIRHVMSGVNPQGVSVTSFKQPGPEALAHDFLWRVHQAVPERGRIGIFNRSHYEEALSCRMHPELLKAQHLPQTAQGKHFWRDRLADIAAFEAYLARQGIVVLKFFLHLSKEEQKRRLLARIDAPAKNWKFSAADLRDRQYWDDYQQAAQAAIAATASPQAPWFIVPADDKPMAQLIVVDAMVAALEALKLHAPGLPPEEQAKLAQARAALLSE